MHGGSRKSSEQLLHELIAAQHQFELRKLEPDQEVQYLKKQLCRTMDLVILLHRRVHQLESPESSRSECDGGYSG